MKATNDIEDAFFIFGSLMVIANKMGTLLDRDLQEFGVTSKQWFLALILETLFEAPPTLKEAARMMGSSYQNVKQIALKLEERGLLRLEKDRKDSRVLRLVLTDQSRPFWAQTEMKGSLFMKSIFGNLNDRQLAGTRRMLQQLLTTMESMEDPETGKGVIQC